MEIKKLLEAANFNWPEGIDELEKDLNKIVDLISSLPEPENLDSSILEKYASLANDEEDKQAKKEDILKEDLFVI